MAGANGENGSNGRAAQVEVRKLDPKSVKVTRDAFDHLCLTVSGDEKYENVKVARAFPLSSPEKYISFLTHEGKEIGMLPDLKGLDGDSLRNVGEELELTYFTPIVQKIHAVESKHGATTWSLQTDRGDKTVHVKERGDIRRMPGRRILFNDVHGMKYDLPDYTKLDERSRTLLENEI